MSLTVDLHCHTSCSDGTLNPRQLIALADERKIDYLAITDHDTDAAFETLSPDEIAPLKLIVGAEFSTRWAQTDVHVVALDFDRRHPRIRSLFQHQSDARAERNRRIAVQLERLGAGEGLERLYETHALTDISRTHFADLLVGSGRVKSRQQAFKRYLRQGRRAYARADWVALGELCGIIEAAGGVTAIAHPAKYRLSHAKLGEFTAEFAALGGNALEVVSGKQSPAVTTQLARLAERSGLVGSVGSDFHRPDEAWAALGRCSAFPAAISPLWSRWV